MESPQHLIARHLRHLDFVRTSIGGAHAERVAAFFTVTQDDPPMWEPIGAGAAGMLEVHERAMIAMGYRRMLGGETNAIRPLEQAMVTRALSVYLPRLGPPGERVKKRMLTRGLLAVPHHLLSEMESDALLEIAEQLRDGVFALDDAISVASLRGDPGASWLAVQRLAIRRPLLAMLWERVDEVPGGWPTLAACWLTVACDFGTSEDLDNTEVYSAVEHDETGAFDLMKAYELTL